MKAILSFVVLLLCLTSVFAQEADMAIETISIDRAIMPPVPPGGTLGQNHYYSVVFDEEGEAAVGAKLQVQNTGKEELKELVIEIPGKNIRMINIVQEVQTKQKRCIYWAEKECMQWEEYEGWPQKYYSVESKEEELSKSRKYTLKLPVPMEEQKTAVILLYYKVEDYAEKSLGTFDFDFETLKVGQDVNQIRVAVNVQEKLYLKGVEGEIEYRDSVEAPMAKLAVAEASGAESQQLQDFSNRLEWMNGMVRTASGLDPWESFHVTGEYARSKLALYKGTITGVAVALIAFITLMAYGIKRAASKRENKALEVSIAGIGSGFVLTLVWVVFGYMLKNLNTWIGYQYSDLLAIFIVLMAAIISLVLLVGPALYIGYKAGAKYGFITAGVMLVTMVVLAIIIIVILALTTAKPEPIIYY